MNPAPIGQQYGFSSELSVSRKENDQTVMLGGVGEGDQPWAQVMTQRAAQLLWFKLTQFLYPEKADLVTGLAATAPLRSPTGLTLTTHVDVVQTGDAVYTVVGWMQRGTWRIQLAELEARRLWASLDLVLYPVGWEGRKTKAKKLN